MELNLGPSVVGCQESGWLFQQTNHLKNLGAKIDVQWRYPVSPSTDTGLRKRPVYRLPF